uniref:Protein kinase domain-containing protein n=1 Tax=Haemonchus contortus TaxID=6289 RepID=A0A7I4YW44_HAECO
MNLYTPADGLFGTHVTWSDIEEDMQRELGTTASFGPNKSAKDIGEGNGFMSKILLIEPDWQHKDKEVPDKFVVKILTQLAMQKLTAEVAEEKKMKNVFNDPEFMASLEKRQKKASTL